MRHSAGEQYAVLASTVNQAPVFPDQDNEMEGRQTAQELEKCRGE